MDFVIKKKVLCEYHGPGGAVEVPKGVTEIGEFAFYHCDSLQSVVIPEGVTKIGKSAFRWCSGLQRVTIPKSLITIEERTFEGCTSLQRLTIPKGVKQIGNHVFENCFALREIRVDSNNHCFHSLEGVLYNGTTLFRCPHKKGESIAIEDGTTEIASYAFAYCIDLQNATIPESVKKIGEDAFLGCANLQSVTIPKGVTEIGEYAFFDCTGLQSVAISERVTGIGRKAFSGCASLQSVTILASISEIEGVFYDPRPILIAPNMLVSSFSEEDKPGACAGFAKLYSEHVPLSEDIRAGYLEYIRSQRKSLYTKAMEYPPLLQLMVAEKVITREDFAEIFPKIIQKGNAERTAMLLEYRHRNLGPVDWEQEFKLEEF